MKLKGNCVINPGDMKSFGFKNCTSIDQLYEALKEFPLWAARFIKKKVTNWKEAYMSSCKNMKVEFVKEDMDKEFEELEKSGQFSLGPLDPDNFFFYLVLDNVKSLFKIER